MSAGLACWGTGAWTCAQLHSVTKSLAYGKTKPRNNANKIAKTYQPELYSVLSI